MSTSEEISAMIEDCLARESKLTEWEISFLENIIELKSLSEKQDATLEKIWDRVTS